MNDTDVDDEDFWCGDEEAEMDAAEDRYIDYMMGETE